MVLVGLRTPNGLAKLIGFGFVITPLEAVLAKATLPESGGFRFRMV